MNQTTAANPEIILDLPPEEYHARPELSRSQGKRAMESPADYHAEKMGWIPPLPITDKLNEGELTHTLLLEPHRFNDSVAIIPEEWYIDKPSEDGIETAVRLLKSNGARNTRGENQEIAWREFEESAAGKIIVKEDQITKVRGMVGALAEHLGRLMHVEHAHCEPSLIWYDDLGGCRARPDYLLVSGNSALVVDIKTTGAKTGREFNKFAQRLGYLWQDVHYAAGVHACFPEVETVDFIFLAIHNPPTSSVGKSVTFSENFPHKVWPRKYTAEDRERGASRWRALRAELDEREASGDWSDPGAGQIETLTQWWD